MEYEAKCAECSSVFAAEEEWLGQQAECPNCGAMITIEFDTERTGKPETKSGSPVKTVTIIALVVVILGCVGSIVYSFLPGEEPAPPSRRTAKQTLQSLAGRDDIEGVKKLLDAGADINEVGAAGTALVYAARSGKSEMVSFLIEQGADVNLKTPSVEAPLKAAVGASLTGDTKAMQILLKHGANVNQPVTLYKNLLLYALETKRYKAAEILIDNGIDVHTKRGNMGPIFYAVYAQKPELVKRLIAKGVSLETSGLMSMLEEAFEKGDPEVFRLISEADSFPAGDKTPDKLGHLLGKAIAKNNVPIVKQLLKIGADPNAEHKFTGWGPPVRQALYSAEPSVFKVLIDSGKVDLSKIYSFENRKLNYTLLHLAMTCPRVNARIPEKVKILLQAKGVDPNAKDKYGRTPLLNGIQKKKTAAVVALLSSDDVDVNMLDFEYEVPIGAVIQLRDIEMLKALLAHKKIIINRKLDFYADKTPLYMAARLSDPKMVGLLLKHGADPTVKCDGKTARDVVAERQRSITPEKKAELLALFDKHTK